MDTDGDGALGSAVSDSSGIFSFGATGVYFNQFQYLFHFVCFLKLYKDMLIVS